MAFYHAPGAVTFMGKCRWIGGRSELGIELRNHHYRESALLLDGIDKTRQSATSARKARPGGVVDPKQARTLYAREPGEPRIRPEDVEGRSGKVSGRNPDMHVSGKSDIDNSTKEPVEQSQLIDSGDGGWKYR
jgi:hypothetical protein